MAAAEAPARPTAEDRIRAALWFAGRGFGVFSCWSTRDDGTCRCPAGGDCKVAGKHPVTLNGFKDATTDPARIRTFLSAASDPNYGLVPPEGVCVWDVDTDAVRTRLASLEARLGPLPATLRTDTGNGQHVFWRWPDGHPRPLRQMFGIVTRWGSGRGQGYVIGPRSVHRTGRAYTPAGVFEIAELPEAWAAEALREEHGTIRVGGPAAPEDVPVGGRHDFLRDRARFLAGSIREPDVLLAAMLAYNDRLPQPKTREDVERAIGDVLSRYGPDPVVEDPETGEPVRRLTPDDDDAPGILPPARVGEFPEDPAPEAFGGLLGECVLAVAEGTDASLAGLLGAVLAFAGALVPGQAYHHRMQTTSPFVALVGESATGRKGTAMWRAHDAFADALDAVYVNRAVLDGLNSGEGLITALAWKQATFPYEPTVGLVFEEEYASLLASRQRESSTLDPKMRAAFDGGPLSNRKAAGAQTVAPPYWLPALIAVTPLELRRRLEADALHSGSANRWLYVPVRRRERDAPGTAPRFPRDACRALADARRRAMDGRPVLSVRPAVTSALTAYQEHLAAVATGVAQDLAKRLPTTAFRLALTHAMAERSDEVAPQHLDRALALTEYARSGIPWVFGPSVGNRDADLLLRHLERSRTMTRRRAERLVRDTLRRQDAVDELCRLGYARVVTVHETRGRPREELHWTGTSSRFSRFSQVPTVSGDPDARNRGTNGTNSVDEGGERWDERVEEGGTKVAEPAPETVVDTATGEVAERRSAEWLRPCRAYPDHRDHHRNTPAGWTCLACDQEEG